MTKKQFSRLRPGSIIVDTSGLYSVMDIGLNTFRVRMLQSYSSGWCEAITYPLVLSHDIIMQMHPYSRIAKRKIHRKQYFHFLYMKWFKRHCPHFCILCKHRGCECWNDYIDTL